MGYSHYWHSAKDKRNETIRPEILSFIKDVLMDGYKKKIIQLESDKKAEPIITDKVIRFNGKDGCSTFNFDLPEGRYDSYGLIGSCTTNKKPYDFYVMVTLLLLSACFYDLQLDSDGEFEVDWKDAIKYVESLGITVFRTVRCEY